MNFLYLREETMKRTKTLAWVAAGTVAAIVLFSAGCDNNKKTETATKPKQEANADFFKEEGNERVTPFLNVQYANGARHDAMLFPQHFDGGHLNNLGRTKVMLMLQDC